MEIFFEVCDIEPLQIFLKTLFGGKLNQKFKRVDFEAAEWFFRFETDSLRGSRNAVSNNVTKRFSVTDILSPKNSEAFERVM